MKNTYGSLILDIKGNIRKTRYHAMKSANRELLLLYYHIGRSLSDRVRTEEWGSKILERISADIQQEFSGIRGFSVRNLTKIRQFYQEYSVYEEHLSHHTSGEAVLHGKDNVNEIPPSLSAQLPASGFGHPVAHHSCGDQIGPTLSVQLKSVPPMEFITTFLSLGFSHHILLLVKCQEIEERYYYMRESVKNQWSIRVLEYHIASNLYSRKGKLTNNFQQSLSGDIKDHALEAFKDEYLLDFLNAEDARSEPLLEKRIISKLKRFMMSLGSEFTFMGNQYRLIVGGDEFFIDLLLFHRTLRCMVVFELKTDKFRPEYAGKMNFYLSALDSIVRHQDENPSIGIVLCREKNNTVVEFAFQDMKKPMGVATYRHGATLPKHARKYLPTPEELEEAIS